MKSYSIYRSNRAEVLLGALAKTMAEPLVDPLAPEVIVVQGRGMGVWLSLELAKRGGVWANADFVYPRHFVRRAFDWVLKDTKYSAADYSRQRLFWALMSELPEHLGEPELAPLADYLTGDHQGRRLFSLCERIADTFDQYLTYRPEMLLRWQSGRAKRADETRTEQLGLFEPGSVSRTDDPWQPLLWRAVTKRLGPNHLARVEAAFLDATADPASPNTLPERIHVFGLSSLPPLYLRVLMALAGRTRVHLYQLSPSHHFWADLALARQPSLPDIELGLVPPKQSSDIGAASEGSGWDPANPLLGSLGQLGAEFNQLLNRFAEQFQAHELEPFPDLYHEPAAQHLLARLQRGILGATAQVADPDASSLDDSIRIHSCHSPMREAEVLHEQILELIAGETKIEPQDIVVLTPDIESYAPFIDAVFDRESDPKRRVPYHVADRSLSATSPVIEAFFQVLDLSQERVNAPQVLDLLANDEVRQAFGLSVDDVEQITTWVTEVNIRWGIDDTHRTRFGLSPNDQNTWHFGLQRLLLGYAQPTQQASFAGVLPFGEVEGQTAQLLGALADFCSKLFEQIQALARPRTLRDWQRQFISLLADLFKPGPETARQIQRIQEAVSDLVEVSESTEYQQQVHAWQVGQLLRQAIDDSGPARGFLTGGVTFCAMVPMRAIPFKVVCLMGMNDRAFPRRDQPNEFDLTLRSARRYGDRSRRIDDRYLYLETLLSARDKVLITYVGQSLKDNSSLPPSVLVNELIEALIEQEARRRGAPDIDPSEANALRRHLVVTHPLQPFSPRYFDASDERLFSYQHAYVQGAAQLENPGAQAEHPVFFAEPLRELPVETTLSLDELLRFIAGPTRYLLNQRLDVWLRDEVYDVPDREPHELAPLDQYAAGSQLLDLLLAGETEQHAHELVRSSGALQIGVPGQLEALHLMDDARQLALAISELRRDGRADPLVFAQSLPGVLSSGASITLSGELGDRFMNGDGKVGVRRGQYARIRAKSLLDLWVKHLVHCLHTPEHAGASDLVARAPAQGICQATFRFVEQPKQHLETLLRCYLVGRDAPLPFFPTSSLSYAVRRLLKDEPADAALRRAQAEWHSELQGDLHYQRAFGESASLSLEGVHDRHGRLLTPGTGFEALAELLFGPLLEHLEIDAKVLTNIGSPHRGSR